jgi:hypothetical protein
MKFKIGKLVPSLFLLLPSYMLPASTLYSFEKVTSFKLGHSGQSVTGIEKDTKQPLTIEWHQSRSGATYPLDRCVSVFIEAVEKPERYYLHLEIEPYNFISCEIEIKN